MALNSWSSVGNFYTGKIELLRVAARTAGSFDFTDSTITGGTYETADFSTLAGTDLVALILWGRVNDNTATDSCILAIREIGDTTASTDQQVRSIRISAELGANNLFTGWPLMIPARGTAPGQFQYTAFSAAHPISVLVFHYWGRIRP